jgi:predicted ABC-type ATPase
VPPRFLIVAGPNGSGKSTLATAFAKDLPYINGDEIKRSYKSETGNSIDQFSLRALIKIRVDEYVRTSKSFAMESNLVSHYSYAIVQELSLKGYHTELIYIGVSDLNTLNLRILQRTLLGKHYISPSDVEQRYKEALDKLPPNLRFFDSAIILDNSFNDAKPTELMHIKRGVIISKAEVLPQWLESKYPIIEKLSNAYRKLNW